MNLHEYQSKEILKQYNIFVPEFVIVEDYIQVDSAIEKLGGDKWVAKAQVHAGGRGKAGGVLVSSDKNKIVQFVQNLQGKNLITEQTDKSGQPIFKFLIEKASDIQQELYFSLTIDRSLNQVICLVSQFGGMNIEKIAIENPKAILRKRIESMVKGLDFQAREIAFDLKLNSEITKQLVLLFKNLITIFFDKDLSMLEINPLVITKDNRLICLDAKFEIDSNSLFRHKELQSLRDFSQENALEVEASKSGLNYIALDGSIACMVNGAGLAMATMDMITLAGGKPANFLDVGGNTSSEKVTEAFKIILSNPNVKSIFINIFGGIVRCDIIAEGVLAALREVRTNLPIIVRLEGNNALKSREVLKNSNLSNIIVVDNLTEAAQKAVKVIE